MTTIALENKKKIRGVVLSDDIIKELKDTGASARANSTSHTLRAVAERWKWCPTASIWSTAVLIAAAG